MRATQLLHNLARVWLDILATCSIVVRWLLSTVTGPTIFDHAIKIAH